MMEQEPKQSELAGGERAAGSDLEPEEWFLSVLDEPELPWDRLVSVLISFHENHFQDKADACLDLLCELLVKRQDESRALDMLELKARWHPEEDYLAKCREQLEGLFKTHSSAQVSIRNAGFDQGLPAPECLRRFRTLRNLKPGVLCFEKTWGVGAVVQNDDFYQQVTIDFEREKGHRMALAYAAESVRILDDTHILSMRYRFPDQFAQRMQNDAADVVKQIVFSFSPLSVNGLQNLMIEQRWLAESEWKSFWEAARKRLKADPLVEIPARRQDPIRILDAAKAYDEQWFRQLQEERDPTAVLNLIDEFRQHHSSGSFEAGRQALLAERLRYVISNAEHGGVGALARAAITVESLGNLLDSEEFSQVIGAFYTPERLLAAVTEIPVKSTRALFEILGKNRREAFQQLLLDMISSLPFSVLNEAVRYLRDSGCAAPCEERIRLCCLDGSAGPDLLYWLARNTVSGTAEKFGSAGEIMGMIINVVERTDYTGDRLRVKNQLKELFDQSDWLASCLEALDGNGRHELIRRVRNSPAWPITDRRSILARMVRLYPDLQEALAERGGEPERRQERWTSMRSYRERQVQFEKLVQQDIPQNSQEIGVARSYGDLKENFEYKAAKDRQTFLLRRRAELEQMLSEVKITDFSNCRCDVVGMGTRVTLELSNLQREQYFILGEFDSDEQRHVISCRSALAKALGGHRPGDQVVIPGETGAVTCAVVDITALPDDIKNWASPYE